MSQRINRSNFTLLFSILLLSFTPTPIQAQFEQKMSINLSGGFFKTIGSRGYQAEWSTGKEDREPTLMPNFKPGFSMGGGFQVNLNRHFSIEVTAVIMSSPGWYFDYSDEDQEAFNYLYFEVYADTIDYTVQFSGENEMTLTNLVIGLAPKYYIRPGNKINPYAFAGITYSITNVNFIDNEYAAYEENGRLDELETNDVNNWFSNHSGPGISLGAGVEYGINDYIGLFMQAGYYFTPLKDESFIYSMKYVDFHAINLRLGLRLSFLKSKEL